MVNGWRCRIATNILVAATTNATAMIAARGANRKNLSIIIAKAAASIDP
jgi:hypothetical protein